MVIWVPGLGPCTGTGTEDQATNWAAPLMEMRAYWEALCDGPLPPFRSQIDPRGIERALGGAFVLERIAPGHGRFRIAGMTISALAGSDVRGMPLSALFEPAARDALSRNLDAVFSEPARLDLRLEAERGIGRPALAARMMILPLRSALGETNLALGGIVLNAEPGRRARRFHLSRTVLSLLQKPAKAQLAIIEPTLVNGFADPATSFATSPGKTERPYLRLVRPAD